MAGSFSNRSNRKWIRTEHNGSGVVAGRLLPRGTESGRGASGKPATEALFLFCPAAGRTSSTYFSRTESSESFGCEIYALLFVLHMTAPAMQLLRKRIGTLAPRGVGSAATLFAGTGPAKLQQNYAHVCGDRKVERTRQMFKTHSIAPGEHDDQLDKGFMQVCVMSF